MIVNIILVAVYANFPIRIVANCILVFHTFFAVARNSLRIILVTARFPDLMCCIYEFEFSAFEYGRYDVSAEQFGFVIITPELFLYLRIFRSLRHRHYRIKNLYTRFVLVFLNILVFCIAYVFIYASVYLITVQAESI